MVRQEDAVLVLFRMREVVLRSSLSGIVSVSGMEGATPEALEQLRRIEAIAAPYAMQPQSIMEEQESRRELYDGLKRLTQREQTYLLHR